MLEGVVGMMREDEGVARDIEGRSERGRVQRRGITIERGFEGHVASVHGSGGKQNLVVGVKYRVEVQEMCGLQVHGG